MYPTKEAAMTYEQAYTRAYGAALKVASGESTDVRVAKDRASAAAAIVASAVKAGDAPGAWFKNDAVRFAPVNHAAICAVEVAA